MLVLITNDDGYEAKGIRVLYESLKKIKGIIPYTISPYQQKSGASTSITIDKPIKVHRIKENFFAIEGTPADCVFLGLESDLLPQKPEMIFSGINHGLNVGIEVFYSGTVGAAIQGYIYGLPAVAISTKKEANWEIISSYLPNLLKKIIELKENFEVLNINLPPKKYPKGIKITHLAKAYYKQAVLKRSENEFELFGELIWEKEETSDAEAIENDFISITPLHFQIVDKEAFKKIKEFERIKI